MAPRMVYDIVRASFAARDARHLPAGHLGPRRRAGLRRRGPGRQPPVLHRQSRDPAGGTAPPSVRFLAKEEDVTRSRVLGRARHGLSEWVGALRADRSHRAAEGPPTRRCTCRALASPPAATRIARFHATGGAIAGGAAWPGSRGPLTGRSRWAWSAPAGSNVGHRVPRGTTVAVPFGSPIRPVE